jgi:primary-amine oxidase
MPLHPLEPVSAPEIRQVVRLLKTLAIFTPFTRIISIILREPEKSIVYRWQGGEGGDRQANAVIFDNAANTAYAVRINITGNAVIDWAAAPAGSQPTLSMDEQVECEQAVLASEEFRKALKRHHGITDTSLVMVDIWSAGNYGSDEESSRRLARPLCFLRSDPTDNGYARPIEGIRPVVDLNSMQVIGVEEYGEWPLPPQQGNYASSRVPDQRTDIKPLEIAQPLGPSFTLSGKQLNWQSWSMVVGFNAREGLTIHDVRYQDKWRNRPIFSRVAHRDGRPLRGSASNTGPEKCVRCRRVRNGHVRQQSQAGLRLRGAHCIS